ncbi:hypothetical protein [Virgisporangium aurantiacum]|uniref:Uncharacterized protein n=1 Tax=Virgisporangium aurantiacum TaxID=175570 RepID=A0A8J4DXM5_9ACTN|nr:hypothetical protein [Virgisporangium aurantiacum]GIJ54069.1 hypothetical protein Vau01_015850 [Virgisporangium aurantiacum]
MARTNYLSALQTLVEVPFPDPAVRQVLRPILRSFAIQQAALTLARPWRLYDLLRLLSGIACVVAPAWISVGWLPPAAPGSRLSAGSIYLVTIAAIVVTYGHFRGLETRPKFARLIRRAQIPVGITFAALVTAAVAVALVESTNAWLTRGLGAAVTAVSIFMALLALREAALTLTRRRVIRPWAARPGGWPMPPQLAAVRIMELLHRLHAVRTRCRQSRFRAGAVREMETLIIRTDWEIRNAAPVLGLGTAVIADAASKASRLTAHLRQLQVRMIHDDHLHEYDRVVSDAVGLVTALARGDWSQVTTDEDDPHRPAIVVRLAKGILPASVLTAAAIGLPHIPGVAATGAALTSIQIGLAAAAALSLIPVDAPHRDHVLNALSSATRRNP